MVIFMELALIKLSHLQQELLYFRMIDFSLVILRLLLQVWKVTGYKKHYQKIFTIKMQYGNFLSNSLKFVEKLQINFLYQTFMVAL